MYFWFNLSKRAIQSIAENEQPYQAKDNQYLFFEQGPSFPFTNNHSDKIEKDRCQ
jgi:hypothetical protein